MKKVNNKGFAISVLDINEKEGLPDKYLLFMEINQNDFNKLHKMIKEFDKNAFIVANESKTVINGYFLNK